MAGRGFGIGLWVLGLFCCQASALALDTISVTSGPTLTMDPNGVTPLAGAVELSTDVPSRVTLDVDDGVDSWSIAFPDLDTEHFLPLLGLKPDSIYTVQVTVKDADGSKQTLDPTLQAVTDPLPDDFPVISVPVAKPGKMEPRFTLLDKFSRGRGSPGTTYTIILDHEGEVVWYSTLGASAMQQLPNGNLRYRSGRDVIEIDMLGAEISTVNLAGTSGRLHHDLIGLEDGGFLSLGRQNIQVDGYPTSDTDPNAPTQVALVRDEPVVEFGPDGSQRDIWLLTDLLDPRRIGYGSLIVNDDGSFDWAHDNAVIHDARDDSIIVSIRHQDAVVKFSRQTGELQWILGPHANWSAEFQPYLLQPLGERFEWQFHQHAPMWTDKGTLILHDNGNHRASPFDGTTPTPDMRNYSRAVEYKIDEEAMTVRQVWEYGSNVPEVVYSRSRGDADWLETTGNALITYSDVQVLNGEPSSASGLGASHTRLIEVTRETPAEKVFELVMFNPATDGRVFVYRSERLPSLYASDVVVDAALVGMASAGSEWASVPAPSGFIAPVVIAGPPTFKGTNEGVVRIRGVRDTGFEMRFQEWDFRERDLGDTYHQPEDVPFVVLPSGQHMMSDGSVWEVGTFPLKGTGRWQDVSFRTAFAAAPHVFLTLQTTRGSEAVTVRARRVDEAGFEAAMFEEEALMGSGHAQEIVGYLAIASSIGGGVLNLNGEQTPYLLQRLSADHRWVPVVSQRLKLEEERSANSETEHRNESLDVLVLGDQIFAQIVSDKGFDTVALRRLPPPDDARMEWGLIRGVDHRWQTLPFFNSYADPVVVAKAVSDHDPDPGVIRLRDVGSDRAQLRYAEWDYLRDRHGALEDVFYIVAEAGRHTVGTLAVEAGHLDSNKLAQAGQWENVALADRFDSPPVVLSSVQSNNGLNAVTTRLRNITSAGFSLAMDEQELNEDGHAAETLGWIAIAQGAATTSDGRRIEAFFDGADDHFATVDFTATHHRHPTIVTDIASSRGMDPVFPRYANPTDSQFQVKLAEERSQDAETTHTVEDISVFVGE